MPEQTRWKCLLCGRNKFTAKIGHKCVGGFRKRKIKWKCIVLDENFNRILDLIKEIPSISLIDAYKEDTFSYIKFSCDEETLKSILLNKLNITVKYNDNKIYYILKFPSYNFSSIEELFKKLII